LINIYSLIDSVDWIIVEYAVHITQYAAMK